MSRSLSSHLHPSCIPHYPHRIACRASSIVFVDSGCSRGKNGGRCCRTRCNRRVERIVRSWGREPRTIRSDGPGPKRPWRVARQLADLDRALPRCSPATPQLARARGGDLRIMGWAAPALRRGDPERRGNGALSRRRRSRARAGASRRFGFGFHPRGSPAERSRSFTVDVPMRGHRARAGGPSARIEAGANLDGRGGIGPRAPRGRRA